MNVQSIFGKTITNVVSDVKKEYKAKQDTDISLIDVFKNEADKSELADYTCSDIENFNDI